MDLMILGGERAPAGNELGVGPGGVRASRRLRKQNKQKGSTSRRSRLSCGLRRGWFSGGLRAVPNLSARVRPERRRRTVTRLRSSTVTRHTCRCDPEGHRTSSLPLQAAHAGREQ